MSTPETIIIVFTKHAIPGAVKTRLVPPLTPPEAAEFHLVALDDVIAAARAAAPAALQLHVAGGTPVDAELGRRYPDLQILPQAGGDLGARLAAAFRTAFESGHQRVLIVGSDHPTLPPENFKRGFALLRSSDVVIGPSRDGGYYLVGIRKKAWPGASTIFESIPWSTARVLEASLGRARGAGLKVGTLPEWYDVDRPADLERLARDAAPDSASARFIERLRSRTG